MKHQLLLLDPPWAYRNAGVQGAAEGEYPTMTVEDLRALPVGDAAAADAVLLLWATLPCLPDAMSLFAAYGFAYVTGFPWVKLHGDPQRNLWGEYEYKPQYGTGFWVRGCAELVLLGKRGKATPADMGDFCGIVSENFHHSRKPANLYDYAEAQPGPYLEIFGRRTRPGWTTLGNDIDGRDIRASLADTIAREGDAA